jgi:hypothetical protein
VNHIATAELHHRSRMGVVPLLSPVRPSPSVVALWEAVVARGKGDREAQATAEADLAQMAAAAGLRFEVDLAEGFNRHFACMLPDAASEDVERAARVDVLRHVGRAKWLAGIEPWGSA